MMKTWRRRHEWQETFSILGENGVKFDVDEEAWPNADLAIRASYEYVLIDGLPADEVKAGDEREFQQMKDMHLYTWVKETDIPPSQVDSAHRLGTAIEWESSEIEMCTEGFRDVSERCRICADTLSIVSAECNIVRSSSGIGDLVCAFMQADSSFDMFAGQEREGWIWRLHGVMNGMRTANRHFTEFLSGTLTEHLGFKRWKLERDVYLCMNRTKHVWVFPRRRSSHLSWISDTWKILDTDHEIGGGQERRSSQFTSTSNLLGIRIPRCTPWWPRSIHSETYCQVRWRMLAHCSTAARKGSDDAFDGTEKFESAWWDDSVWSSSTLIVQSSCRKTAVRYWSETRFDVRHKMFVIQTCVTNTCRFDTCPESVWDIKCSDMNLYLTILALKPNDLNKTLKHKTGYSDAEWAGDLVTRKSTSCTLFRWSISLDECMSRTGVCCLVQRRIRNVCSWCIYFRTSRTERKWTIIPDTRESRQQHSTHSGNETRSKF